MARKGDGLLAELHDLVNQIGNGCDPGPPCSCCEPPPCSPCFPPTTFPYAEVVMTCPPPVLAPTRPEPVKPLQLPCNFGGPPPLLTQEERELTRYDNFYNNYNMDWHNESPRCKNKEQPVCTPEKKQGQAVDGKSPCCNECIRPPDCSENAGCPTGFKPCTMKLAPPPCCHPYGIWCAEIQPCPPKCRKSPQFEVGAAAKSKNCDK